MAALTWDVSGLLQIASKTFLPRNIVQVQLSVRLPERASQVPTKKLPSLSTLSFRASRICYTAKHRDKTASQPLRQRKTREQIEQV